MINRAGLETLPPAKRAELIYGEAQAEMSRRLWQVALGDSGNDKDADFRRSPALASRGQDGSSLDALLAELTQQATGRRQTVETSQAPRNARPVIAPVEAPPRITAPVAAEPIAAPSGTGPIKGLGPNSCYSATLAAAADRVGVPAPALAAIVEAEAGKAPDGSWKVYSRNPRSSAAGLGQFLNRTWEGLAETRGTWLNGYAAQQGWLGADGQVRADSRAAVLATRYDPTAAINGIADYARRNLDGLRRAGVSTENDVSATARLAYLGHHLGLGDAVRFLRGNGLSEERARVLLNAQVGVSNSSRRIAATGDATVAHREWLVGYLDRNIHTDRFSRQGNA